jgi:SAM-dependent MidA family methyltransferase
VTSTEQTPLAIEIGEEIEREGGITFARFMQRALYDDPLGYYRSPERRPGRGGDFITAPEMHPLFGIAISRHIAECWSRMGEPPSFVIREYGAGVGGLAYDIIAGLLDAHPELRPGLRYEMIELNDHRRRQAMRAMTEVGLGDVVVAAGQPEPGTFDGVILANEVADALPIHRLIVRSGSLREAWVIRGASGGFAWDERELSPDSEAMEIPEYLVNHGVDLAELPEGSVIEVSPALREWTREIAQSLRRGYALIVDYGYPATELLREHRLQGTLRGYSRHTVNEDPFIDVGMQDLTAHLDFSSVIEAAEAHGMRLEGLTTQADFLERVGLGELLVNMQQQEGMTIDVYYRAQAAVYRLIDPGGMGRFRVLGLSKGMQGASPLRGFTETATHL